MTFAPRLAVSSWCWHEAYYAGRWSLLELPSAASRLDFRSIEANDFMAPPPRFSRVRRPLLRLLPGAPVEFWRYDRRTLEALRRAARRSQVRLLAWTLNSDFAIAAWRWPAQWIYLRQGVLAARTLQARLLRITLGGSSDTPAALDGLIQKRLLQFLKVAFRLYPGLHVTLENHWGVSADIQRHLRLFDAVKAALPEAGRSQFGGCFDPGNTPLAARDQWPALAERANHYHFKTNLFGAAGEEESLPHAALLQLLAATGYRGDVTIEFEGPGQAANGILKSRALFEEWLRLNAKTAAG